MQAPTDPTLLYDTHRQLSQFDVIHAEDIDATVAVLVSMRAKEEHGRVYNLLNAAGGASTLLSGDDIVKVKGAPDSFVRTYGFLSQIVGSEDNELERDYLYCRALASVLRGPRHVERVDLGSAVELTHTRCLPRRDDAT